MSRDNFADGFEAELWVPGNGTDDKRFFHSVDEFEKFLQQEQAFWREMRTPRSGNDFDVHCDSRNSIQKRAFETLVWDKWASVFHDVNMNHLRGGDEVPQEHRVRAMNKFNKEFGLLQDWYAGRELPTSDSALADRIRTAYETDGPTGARAAVAYLAKPAKSDGSEIMDAKMAIIENRGAALFMKDSDAATAAMAQVIDGLTARLAQVKSTAKDVNSDIKREKQQLIEELEKQIDQCKIQARTSAELARSRKRRLDKYQSAVRSRINNLFLTFRGHMQIDAPRAHWEARAKKAFHLTCAAWFMLAVVLVGGVAGVTIWGTKLLKTEVAEAISPNQPTAAQVSPAPQGGTTGQNEHDDFLRKIILLTIPLFFLVVTLRILVKMALTQTHIWVDASERCVMIKTYISLTKEQGKLPDSAIIAVFNRISRPTATGLVKADPVGGIHPLSKVVSG